MEYSSKAVLERIEELIRERGIKEAEFCRSLGLGKTAVTDWRRRGQSPNAATLFAISTRYQVSIDYLLTGRETKQITHDALITTLRERALLDKFRKLPPDLQDMALTYLDGMLNVLAKSKETAS